MTTTATLIQPRSEARLLLDRFEHRYSPEGLDSRVKNTNPLSTYSAQAKYLRRVVGASAACDDAFAQVLRQSQGAQMERRVAWRLGIVMGLLVGFDLSAIEADGRYRRLLRSECFCTVR